jgi:hypothetical protein
VLATGERPQPGRGLLAVVGLAVGAPVERDDRVGAEHQLAFHRRGLALRVLEHQRARLARHGLVDPRHPNPEVDPELGQDGAALRGR